MYIDKLTLWGNVMGTSSSSSLVDPSSGVVTLRVDEELLNKFIISSFDLSSNVSIFSTLFVDYWGILYEADEKQRRARTECGCEVVSCFEVWLCDVTLCATANNWPKTGALTPGLYLEYPCVGERCDPWSHPIGTEGIKVLAMLNPCTDRNGTAKSFLYQKQVQISW